MRSGSAAVLKPRPETTMDGSTSEHSYRTVGEQPRPRVLLAWSGDDAEAVQSAIALRAPTLRATTSLSSIRQKDYDVLVTDHLAALDSNNIEPHLFVVSIVRGEQEPGKRLFADQWSGLRGHTLLVTSEHRSDAVRIAEDSPSSVIRLVEDLLLPVVRQRMTHQAFHFAPANPNLASPGDTPVMKPFVTDPDGHVLAASYPRSPTSEGWVLPGDVPCPERWAVAALEYWALELRAFPLYGEWWNEDEWRTASEAASANRVIDAQQELEDTSRELRSKAHKAEAALVAASDEAARGSRRLLTEKGEPLKEAVAAALRSLGYEVEDVDNRDISDLQSGLREDLAVSDPDDAAVDPLIEVKGYDKGAKASDLASILRHLTRRSTKPTSLWWVINFLRFVAPGARQELLIGEQAMIDDHAAQRPPLLIIDTRDLFRVLRRVGEGSLDASEVRSSLRDARGRWSPPLDSGPEQSPDVS